MTVILPHVRLRAARLWAVCALAALALLLAGCSGSAPSKPREFSDEVHEAVESGNIREIKKLVALGADVNQRHPDTGETPLSMAIRLGEVEAVQQLLLNGADPNRRTKGSTPLHEAAAKGNIEVARLLLDAGANWDVRDSDNKTPLEVAQGANETRFYFYLEDAINKRK